MKMKNRKRWLDFILASETINEKRKRVVSVEISVFSQTESVQNDYSVMICYPYSYPFFILQSKTQIDEALLKTSNDQFVLNFSHIHLCKMSQNKNTA